MDEKWSLPCEVVYYNPKTNHFARNITTHTELTNVEPFIFKNGINAQIWTKQQPKIPGLEWFFFLGLSGKDIEKNENCISFDELMDEVSEKEENIELFLKVRKTGELLHPYTDERSFFKTMKIAKFYGRITIEMNDDENDREFDDVYLDARKTKNLKFRHIGKYRNTINMK